MVMINIRKECYQTTERLDFANKRILETRLN